jgi:AraC-like DNA-binding protein
MSTLSEMEGRRMRASREELAERLARAMPRDGSELVREDLGFARFARPTELTHGFYEPSLCVIVQGAKEITVGAQTLRYDPAHYLIFSVGLPATARVVEASPHKPYLALRLMLDPSAVTSVMVEAGLASPRSNGSGITGIAVSTLDADLLDALLRVVRLIRRPEEYRIIGQLSIREIIYRLLTGEQRDRMAHLATAGGHANRMVRVIEKLRRDFDQPLHIPTVAKELRMSASSFHAHFKAITAMTPLQFQKHLRLQEARRLMLSEDYGAAEAGYHVGYDDASHFSRDYKRHFGEPPKRDVERLRMLAGPTASA